MDCGVIVKQKQTREAVSADLTPPAKHFTAVIDE
jgi:hypothetical protein